MAFSTYQQSAKEIKVVLLGETFVGKSSLAMRFVAGEFRDHVESTIGASFMSKIIPVDENPIKFQIWDTAGMEKYRSLAPMYYRGAAAAIIVYDVTRAETLKTAKRWMQELSQHGPDNIVVTIAGNKCDVTEREVTNEEGKQYADEIGAMFIETSAKENTNVTELFIEIGRRLPKPQFSTKKSKKTNIADLNSQTEKKRCC